MKSYSLSSSLYINDISVQRYNEIPENDTLMGKNFSKADKSPVFTQKPSPPP